jgi:hypothetical protein
MSATAAVMRGSDAPEANFASRTPKVARAEARFAERNATPK